VLTDPLYILVVTEIEEVDRACREQPARTRLLPRR
jgi:hypothetical protein